MLVCLTAGPQRTAQGGERTTGTQLVGALRWDNWRLDSAAGEVLADPTLRNRIPYFAWREPDGRLGFPGNLSNAMHADVEYARAAGIDYFIFGYYLETGSWGRNAQQGKALNSAYRNYLSLSDRAGVKFALNFDWSFPVEDVPAVSEAIAAASRHPDAVRTADGAIPVFFFTPDLATWARGLKGESGARQAIVEIRRRVLKSEGKRLFIVALAFNIEEAGPIAAQLGFDALSTYSNGLGGGGRVVPYGICAEWARRYWDKGAQLSIGFLPTVTFGWDFRPMQKRPDIYPNRTPNPSWCAPASDAEWGEQIREAVELAKTIPHNTHFQSIVLYAWNEFSEGGWIAPTVGEGTRRLAVIAQALGRNRSVPRAELSWPGRSPSDPLTMDWPCPPGSHVEQDATWPSLAVAKHPATGVWQKRVCN